MRNIKEFAGTTPTYVYNISDASSVGMELDKMNIGMSISLGSNVYYILPDTNPAEIFDVSSVPAANVWRNDNYCRHVPNSNQYRLTLPLWRIPSTETTTEGTFQIFLFMTEAYSVFTTRDAPYDGSGGNTTPMVVNPLNVVIDYGGFALLDRTAPPLIGTSKRGDNLVFI